MNLGNNLHDRRTWRLLPAPPSGSVIRTKGAAIKNKFIKGPQGTVLNADHIVKLGVVQGGARAYSAAAVELENPAFFLVATMINGDVCDLARFDEEYLANDAGVDLVNAIAYKESGPIIEMFPRSDRLTWLSSHDVRLDRELASRNEAVRDALGALASSIVDAIEDKKIHVRA